MVWGQSGSLGLGDWIDKLKANDPNLKSLTVLASRSFTQEDVKQLCEALSVNSSLTELNAGGRSLSTESAAYLGEMLTRNAALTNLCIGDQNLGDEGVSALAQGLRENKTLRHLDLENKGLGQAGLNALGAAIVAGAGLRTLNLSRNLLSLEGVSGLPPGWMGGLRELNLAACHLTAQGLTALATNSAAEGLETLTLDDNLLGEEGGEALARLLLLLPSLKCLSLRRCGLGDQGLASMMDSLTKSVVRQLDLEECEIGPEGARHLADGLLERPSSLEVLKLRGNCLTDAGAEILAEALVNNTQLRELDVGSNRMECGAVDVVKGGIGLVKVSLFNSRLGDIGGGQLASALAADTYLRLQELELGACALDAEALVAIFTVLQSGAAPALELLLIGANPGVDANSLEFLEQVEMLRAARPDLDIAWQPSDQGNANAMRRSGSPPSDA